LQSDLHSPIQIPAPSNPISHHPTLPNIKHPISRRLQLEHKRHPHRDAHCCFGFASRAQPKHAGCGDRAISFFALLQWVIVLARVMKDREDQNTTV
jgi:hypothetical protein